MRKNVARKRSAEASLDWKRAVRARSDYFDEDDEEDTRAFASAARSRGDSLSVDMGRRRKRALERAMRARGDSLDEDDDGENSAGGIQGRFANVDLQDGSLHGLDDEDGTRNFVPVVLGDSARVKNNLRIFNMCYLQAIKEEADRCKGKHHKTQRPDLKALTKMRQMKAFLYHKRLGDVPGVNVGDSFFSRAELVSLGIHTHWLNGIDFISQNSEISKSFSNYKLPLAVSIVISGGYEDDVDNAEDIIYTGQGGNNLSGDRRQIKDQKLALGNLALKHSIDEGTPVRVFRGHDSKHSYTKRIYTYDGLYKVLSYWSEEGVSGFTVYKFKLRRCEGQPVLTTEQVRFCKEKIPTSPTELKGLVCEDISNGLERIPVVASNLVDADEPCAPNGYTYVNKVIIDDAIEDPSPAPGCNCKGVCVDPQKCSCAKRNGNTFPYVDSHGYRLAVPLDVVYECNPNCRCGPGCINRATQRGLQYRLEVYKTNHKGWAVRSWDPIPAGAPVCEYYGKVIKSDGLEVKSDVYLFDLDCIQTMRGVDGRQRRWGDLKKFLDDQNGKTRKGEDTEAENPGYAEFCLDGNEYGGVARFINHSCEPNLFIQCVLSTHLDMRIPRIMFFAADNIAPLQELSYDYGYLLNSVVGPDGKIKELPCYCGALTCRKRLY